MTERGQILTRIQDLEATLAELRRELVAVRVDDATTIDVLSFAVHDKAYAVWLSDVVEVLRMVKWSPLPKAPPDIQGVVNCRGTMLPLLNPGRIVGTTPVPTSLGTSLIVVSASGQSVALVVDHVLGVESYKSSELNVVSSAELAHRTFPPFVVGFIKKESDHVSVIDVNLLLDTEDRRALDSALRERDEWGQF